MHEISRQNFIPDTEYYFEIIPHRSASECNRFIGTFTGHMNFMQDMGEWGNGMNTSVFRNVRCANPNKRVGVENMELTNNISFTWRFYEKNLEERIQSYMDRRTMQKAFNKVVEEATGDQHFRGGPYLDKEQYPRRGMTGQHPPIPEETRNDMRRFVWNAIKGKRSIDDAT
jgi:hypothetical protein